MIVVTGAAGFIGSCIVSKLNELGHYDLITVDHLDVKEKKENLKNKKYRNYYEKSDFLNLVKNQKLNGGVTAIIHMGACSSTTLQDAKYFQENNFEYTCHLARWALDCKARFIYASSAATYGDGSLGYKDDEATTRKLKPLNLYGESKQKFDIWALDQKVTDRMAGLKFFNVFGPNEYHKGDMRSVVAKSYQKVIEEGKMKLFKSNKKEYGDGEQKRDFIYVKDAVDIVLYFFDNHNCNGIFNAGTGQARTWNDLAYALFKAVKKPPHIEYIDMPENLKGKYQYFTEGDMSKLRAAGYKKPFTKLEDAVSDYVQFLQNNRRL